jgi:hypothetical protein
MPCKHEGCKIKYPSYGHTGTKTGIYCVIHKEPEMTDVKNKICKNCSKIASYGEKGTKKGIYCFDHKLPGSVNVVSNRCLVCNKLANYGKLDTKVGIYCVKHKLEDMVDVLHKTCLKCKKRPTYGIPGTKLGIYCKAHKEINTINVTDRTCIRCEKIPNFNVPGNKKGIYCFDHKEVGMIRVKRKMCVKCEKTPSYGLPGTKTALYCSDHKVKNSIDLCHKKCLDCDKRPNYGKPGTKNGIYCCQHKEEGMVDLNKKCIEDGCQTCVRFGKLFEPKIHCYRHKMKNEFKNNYPKCEDSGCKEQPCFTNRQDNYPLRCEDHKLDEDSDVIRRPCDNCKQEYYLKNGNLCEYCHMFHVEKVNKKKEVAVKEMLDAREIEYQTWDKIPKDSCLRYRPDFVLDMGTHIVILEVDENQHNSYERECETARMMNICQDFGGMYVCFVRYNPDGYKNSEGIKVKCMKGRENRLITLLGNLREHPPKHQYSAIYLYYNGDDGTNKFGEIVKDNAS